LLANIALSRLDEHFDQQWQHEMGSFRQRANRRRHGNGNWKLVRYADLCRGRHKSAYAEVRVMPTQSADALVSGLFAAAGSA
jgi:RNA-directed DNA polymerase